MKYPLRRTLTGAFALVFVVSLPVTAQSLVSSSLPDSPGYAQQAGTSTTETTGVIEGEVTDSHGALVPGASVTLSEKGHAALHDTTTDSAGHFTFKALGPGSYSVLVAAPSFKTYFSPDIELHPGEHSEMPAIALAIATADTSVDVSADSTAVAEQELKRETQQRIIGIVPNFYTSFVYDAAPLDAKQKFKLNAHSVFDPTIFLGVAITAGLEQERNTFPSWGNSDAASYGKRFAAGYGDALLTHTFGYALYPAIFHQDPRYFYLGPTNKMSTRIRHALLNGVLTRGDNGHQEINFSHLLGSASAGALSSVYHPASDSAGYLAGVNLGVGIGGSALEAIFREFVWPHFTTHVPSYANGKTSQPASTKP